MTAAQGLWSNNAMTIGGGTRVYGAQAWRLAPEDFAMASTYGVPGGSALADWPIGYDDLEPFYARVETMLGVSGTTGHDPWEGPRSAPLAMGPLAPSPLTGLLAGAAERLGFGTQPVPLLVNSRPHGGRAACSRCAQCVGFDCPVRARAGSHNTTLPRALASGNATLLPGAQAARILVDAAGRARSVDLVGEKGGRIWRRTVGAGTVVLAAGAIESARLLLDSACDAFPGGLGNAHDQVGRHLQGHAYGGASALFAEEVVDLRGPGPSISTADFRHGNDGVIGGGILADEFVPTPASTHQSLRDTGLVPPTARLGSPEVEGAMLRFARIVGPIQEVTSASSRVRIDAGSRDRLGRSTVRLSGSLHPEDLRGREMLTRRAAAWLREAGAVEVQPMGPIGPGSPPSAGQHQAWDLPDGHRPAQLGGGSGREGVGPREHRGRRRVHARDQRRSEPGADDPRERTADQRRGGAGGVSGLRSGAAAAAPGCAPRTSARPTAPRPAPERRAAGARSCFRPYCGGVVVPWMLHSPVVPWRCLQRLP